ncbi:ParB/RepB/Spo0J family partition protein [Sphingomonas ginkgonis]|uniref:ParB/RepB/Spo0J family partition protein n=1 Tax=Sphingomonas ginkgonis TaxID=2315330 RepID=A0A429V729_9SPHN|nr:ParB/RepB/Spo0J family partition protein [Sphingomonas ginkgonis]RST29750.1 ParB/RepB/Spo0J family partition protein [Sphingomonas ginkgonis]
MSLRKPGMGLGRGLSALLEEQGRPDPDAAPQDRAGPREIEIASIRPNPNQPRRQFDEESIAELAQSISARGVLQPILVRLAAGGTYQIIAGERRWRAAQRAQLHRIPAIVREMDDAATAEVALIENIQRDDLNALEEAQGYKALITTYGHRQEDVAALVHKSRSHVTNLLRLLDLPEFVQKALMNGEINMGHARAVAAAADPEALTREIIEKGLSVRQAEALAKQVRPGGEQPKGAGRTGGGSADADLVALERQLGDVTGLKVKLTHGAKGGTVTLAYSNLDQLDMICQRLSGETI